MAASYDLTTGVRNATGKEVEHVGPDDPMRNEQA